MFWCFESSCIDISLCFLVWFADTLLESMLQWGGNLGKGILIPMRSFGQGFHRKDPSARPRINRSTSNGRIIVPWCSGVASFLIMFTSQLNMVFIFCLGFQLYWELACFDDFPIKWW